MVKKESKKIYVRNGSTDYQIYPVPSDLSDYTVVSVPDDFTQSKYTVLLDSNNRPFVVVSPPLDMKFPKWDGNKWVVDTDKQHAYDVSQAEDKKNKLLLDAKNNVIFYNTFGDKQADEVKQWQDRYIFLTKIDTSLAPNIDWGVDPK